MRAAVLRGEREVKLEEVADPYPGPREVLVRVRAAGICGSDLHVYRHLRRMKERTAMVDPVILGHEYSGDVIGVGSEVDGLRIGDRVVVDPNSACGECPTCRQGGVTALCERLRIYGSAFAEMAVAPSRNAYRIAPTSTHDDASYTEPLSCVLRALDLVGAPTGRTAAVIGCGPAGLLFVQMLSLSGATRVLAIARRPASLLAAKRMGAHGVIDATTEDPGGRIAEVTRGTGAAVVIDTVGSRETTLLAAAVASRGGSVCLYSLPPADEVSFAAWHIFEKELRILGANRNSGTFGRALALIESGRATPGLLTSRTIGLDDLPDMLSLLGAGGGNGRSAIIKVVVHP